MKRLPKRSKIRICLFVSAVILFTAFDLASAAQDVVYKDARPLKNIFGEDDSSDDQEKSTAYIYDPTGKTDPFKSFIAVREEKEEKENHQNTIAQSL